MRYSIFMENTIEKLTLENTFLTRENNELKGEILRIKEQLEWFKKQIFGKKTERVVADDQQLELGLIFDDESSSELPEEDVEVPGHKRRKSRVGIELSRFEIPEGLPIQEIIIEPPAEDLFCSETGEPMVFWKNTVSDKLAYQPGMYFVKRFIRPIYKSPTSQGNELVIASMPSAPIPKCRADNSLLTHILIQKFADHLPLYRIEEILKRDDIKIQRQTLCGWVLKLGEALMPLYDIMFAKILASERLFTDATTINYLVKGQGSQMGYMYVYSGGDDPSPDKSPPYLVYQFAPDGSYKYPHEILNKFTGLLHSDAHGCYDTTVARKDIIWQPCWAHARRKFLEAGGGPKSVKDRIIKIIQDIFINERQTWDLSSENRINFRQEKQKPLCDELFNIIKEQFESRLLPKDKYTEALRYIYLRKDKFLTFLTHANAVIDNNLSERFMKPLVIGRKNWLFLGSKDSGKPTATILSLVQTCRHLGINPQHYLEFVLENIMDWNSQNLEELLPDRWLKNQAQ